MSREPKVTVTVQLPLELVNKLDAFCRDNGATKVSVITRALERYLEEENN